MSEISFRNHWFPLGFIGFALGLSLLIFATLLASITGLLWTKSWMVAGVIAGITFGGMAIWVWPKAVRKHGAKQELSKSLWVDGTNLFASEWVLDLSVEVPDVVVSNVSMFEFYRQLENYYGIAKAAVGYFSDGKYLIARDGSMRKIGSDEASRLLALWQVSAAIDFDDLSDVDTISRRLVAKPATSMEMAKNCVLIDVHAHGTAQGRTEAESSCMPRFAARDGKIIVESL